MHVLFLCTGNSCRSIIAEALLRAQAPEGVTAHSAGSRPTGLVNPRALVALRQAGLSVKGLASRSWDSLPITPDVVITLCADAEREPCPLYFGDVIRSHWGMPDPAKLSGSEEVVMQAFTQTLQTLKRRIDLFCTLLAAQGHDQSDIFGKSREEWIARLDAIAHV